MSIKCYQLYCEICGYKRITDGSDLQDLVEIKTSAIPRGIPFYNPETKAIETPKAMAQRKKFRCPKCGRVIMARKITVYEQQNDDQPDGCEASPPGLPISGESATGPQ